MKHNYDNRIILKPWGEEYNIYRNKKKCAITYLKIKKNFSTSLHCHPKKKTGFLILSGTAEVQIGIYKKNIFKCPPMSILVLREGLFHKIKASSRQDLFALEIETPYLKKDLVRMEDDYGRKNKNYESLKVSKEFTKQSPIFRNPKKNKINRYKIKNINISISYYKDFDKFKNYDDKSVSIILDGNIVTNDRNQVIGIGEIVKSITLKKLSNQYKVNKRMLVLKAFRK